MNRAHLEDAVEHLRRAELGACCTGAIATVLDALEQYRRTVTTGGPVKPLDYTWGNKNLPDPESATDPNAPALVRGPNRTEPVPR